MRRTQRLPSRQPGRASDDHAGPLAALLAFAVHAGIVGKSEAAHRFRRAEGFQAGRGIGRDQQVTLQGIGGGEASAVLEDIREALFQLLDQLADGEAGDR